DKDPIVQPFYKGAINHGEDLAKLYNSAEYALVVTQPTEVNNQRLAEAAACGAIPVVTDVRAQSEKPHWDDECLFFSNRDELYNALKQKPKNDPSVIANYFSYKDFAKIIIDSVRSMQEQQDLKYAT
ncbi:MAG: glycosyltransferase, partial [Gammaproteobacteria bacterium]|nr:glycosyltransferase [Gammaproteobacteria bacterium]